MGEGISRQPGQGPSQAAAEAGAQAATKASAQAASAPSARGAAQDSLIVIGLHRIVRGLDHRTARIAKRHGLTLGQFAVLEALYHKGDLTIGQVKEAVLSTDGTIPVVARNLEARGLVVRREDPADRRRAILGLTPAGREVIEAAYPENRRMIEEQLSVLDPEQKRQLVALIRCFRGGWE